MQINYPKDIKLIPETANGVLTTIHTGTVGFRATEISFQSSFCIIKVYNSNDTFSPKGVIKICGIKS